MGSELQYIIPKNNFNNKEFIDLCSDKFKTYCFLKNKIKCPDTIEFSEKNFNVMIGKYKEVVIKPRRSEKGMGIFIATKDSKLIGDYRDHIIQERINANDIGGHIFDVRAFAHKNKVWMYSRVARKNEFRTNISLGARAESTIKVLEAAFGDPGILTDVKNITKKIITMLSGFSFIETGLDFLVDKEKKIYLLEINSRPGIRGFYKLANAEDHTYGKITLRYDNLYRVAQRSILDEIKQARGELLCAEL